MTKAYLEPEEIEGLERAAECLRDRLLIRLLFHLGCRVSEALGIKVRQYILPLTLMHNSYQSLVWMLTFVKAGTH